MIPSCDPAGSARTIAAACSGVTQSSSPMRTSVGDCMSPSRSRGTPGDSQFGLSLSKNTGKCSGPSGESESYIWRNVGGKVSGVSCSISSA
jgi:hypothetical protein